MFLRGTMQYIYGRHSSISVLLNKKRTILKVAFQKDLPLTDELQTIFSLAKERGITIEEIDKKSFEKKFSLSGHAHQGVLVLTEDYPYESFENILVTAKKDLFFVILDHVKDPHNLGAIIRTSELAGADAVIIPQNRAALVTRTVVKTSAGGTESIPVCLVTNINQTIDTLHLHNFSIYGLETGNNTTIYDGDYSGDIALVVGEEGPGISKKTLERCDMLLEIPMAGKLASLNVSVATGIALFEAKRKREMMV